MIDIDSRTIEQVISETGAFPGAAEQALKGAVKEGIKASRTTAMKEIPGRYHIPAHQLKTESRVKTYFSRKQDCMVGEVSFAGRNIPLYYFRITPYTPGVDPDKPPVPVHMGGSGWRMMKPGRTVYAAVYRQNSPKKISNAFIAQFQNGHLGVFERTGGTTGSGRESLQELRGPSIAKMTASPDIQEQLGRITEEKFRENLTVQIEKIIQNWK